MQIRELDLVGVDLGSDSCVTSGKSHNLSLPQVPHLYNEGSNNTFLVCFFGAFYEVIHVKNT